MLFDEDYDDDDYDVEDCNHEIISGDGYCVSCGTSLSGCGKLVSEESTRDIPIMRATAKSRNKSRPTTVYGNARLVSAVTETMNRMKVPDHMIEQLTEIVRNNKIEIRGSEATLNKMVYIYMCYLYRLNDVKCTPERLLGLCKIPNASDAHKYIMKAMESFQIHNTLSINPNRLDVSCMLKEYTPSIYIEEFLHHKNGGDLEIYNETFIYPESHRIIVKLSDETYDKFNMEGIRNKSRAAAILIYCIHVNDYRKTTGITKDKWMNLIYTKDDVYSYFVISPNSVGSVMSKMKMKILQFIRDDDNLRYRAPRNKKEREVNVSIKSSGSNDDVTLADEHEIDYN